MENPLRSSLSRSSSGSLMRKSASTRSLASLVDAQAMMAQDEEEQAQQRKRAQAWMRQKPPRHASVPMYARILLELWQRELQRSDVALTSDFFYDLNGTEEHAVDLVARMQALGFSITLPQFLRMHRCSIYSVLLVAL